MLWVWAPGRTKVLAPSRQHSLSEPGFLIDLSPSSEWVLQKQQRFCPNDGG